MEDALIAAWVCTRLPADACSVQSARTCKLSGACRTGRLVVAPSLAAAATRFDCRESDMAKV